jgi:hypothetical protein
VGGVFEMTKLLARRLWLVSTGLFLSLTLGACSTYQSPSSADQLLATVGIDTKDYKLRFVAVDGAFISSMGWLHAFGGRDELKIRPGKRALKLEYTDLNLQKGSSTLVFEAQAGRRYTVHERTEAHKFYTWMTNDSGERVTLLPRE